LATKSKYEKEYIPSSKYVIVNNDDPDLMPIRVPLPPCPDIRTIDGYGLPAKKQKFVKTKLPSVLVDLEEEVGDIEAIYEELSGNQQKYFKEIKYIESEWDKRLNGYWFYSNGTPTYITGVNYLYISHWEIDIGVPEYRSRDRKFFLFANFCDNDPNSFGFNYPKHRREGATNKVQCWLYEATSRSYRRHSGIQSATEDHGRDVFTEHLIPGWKSLPFFFKPIFQGSTDPKRVLLFREPAEKIIKGRIRASKTKALNSRIDFKSSDVKGYDSRKLLKYHSDECGKTTDCDILLRHNVVKQCLSTGRTIVGKAAYTSTVGEMDKGGGARYKQLCDQSHYDHWDDRFKRTKNNRTLSGLYNIFIPAYDGLEGFIDEYGDSIIDEAKEYLRNTREAYITAEDFDSLSEFIRMYPMQYRECFRGDSQKCKFNLKILEDRLDELLFTSSPKTTKGNFLWKDGIKDGKVIWVPSERGKFEISYGLEEKESNKALFFNGLKIPDNTNSFVAGADPYKFKTTNSGKKSDGAGAVWMYRDASLDTINKDALDWRTNRFVCTYTHRPRTKREYGEDMLRMCVFYGCKLNAETNVAFLWDYFDERGYMGYLWYGRDKRTGKINIKPGTYTSEEVREDIFREYHNYIEIHGSRECHSEILRQCLEIEDKMNDYDLFVAGGLALLAAKGKQITSVDKNETESGDVFHRVFSYKV
tara:strand:+ start:6983 stop:9085 length:2103 start_codon:yes stop_codon:yes gene_type:complete